MKWLLVALLVVHGLIHLMGPAKAFGFAELPQLTQAVSRPMGVLWTLASLLMLASAIAVWRAPAAFGILGLVAVAASQAAILAAWTDAKFGTLANIPVLLAALYALGAHGPYSFRREYRRQVAQRLSGAADGPILTEADLAHLPAPVRRYVASSGALGRPRAPHVFVKWRGRIRNDGGDPWMEFTAEQHNFLREPARFFRMDAKRAGLPVDVYHDYSDGHAAMRVRLLSLVPLVDARGAEMDRAESVTLFNDVALFAPWALADPSIAWEPIDDRSALGRYTRGAHPVTATLHFDADDRLVNFVSEDRVRALGDGGFVRQRWSTPVAEYATFDGLRVIAKGEARWHPEDAEDFVYIELEMSSHTTRPSESGDRSDR